ncbi:MAG: TIGR00266 family protein [Deltaproteobacteria bacterium]|nr:TIGR00266 family protein [Deltaproteobacteria bacterium]
MKIEILARPAAAVAKVSMDAGETLIAEVGSMIAMSPSFRVETTSRGRGQGGIMRGIRRMFSGESFFLNHFTATGPGQEIILGATLAGDVKHHRLAGGTLVVQGGSWMGSGAGIDIDTTFQGLGAGLLGGEGLFWVKCSGQGDLLLESFGAIYEVDVRDEYIVDTGHIVAYEDTLHFEITKAGESWIGSFLGGEGLACRFKGQGKLYCQSHNPASFGKAIGPRLRPIRR